MTRCGPHERIDPPAPLDHLAPDARRGWRFELHEHLTPPGLALDAELVEQGGRTELVWCLEDGTELARQRAVRC